MEDDQKMGERTFMQAHAIFQWAKERVHIANIQMKERYDAQGVNTIQYKKGDLVGFSVTNLRIRHPNRRTKLLPKYIGPLKVLERVGMSAVKLELPKYRYVFLNRTGRSPKKCPVCRGFRYTKSRNNGN